MFDNFGGFDEILRDRKTKRTVPRGEIYSQVRTVLKLKNLFNFIRNYLPLIPIMS